MSSYYDILQVKQNSTINDIKKSYHKLALKYHPDRNNDTNGEEFKNINNAYNTLINPEKRDIYDMTLKLRSNIFLNDSVKDFNFNDIHIFGVDATTFIQKTRDFLNITKNIIHTYNKKKHDDIKKKSENHTPQQNNDYDHDHNMSSNEDSDIYYDTSPDIRTPDIYHDVFINLNEIYDNKIKKVNVKVKRYNAITEIYEYVKIKLLIEPSEKINIFENEADDIEGYTMRGDIIINIIPIDYHTIIYLEKNDVYLEKNISIYELCYGITFHLHFLDNKIYKVCLNSEIDIEKLYIIEGMGLKNFTDDSTDRLLIKFKLKIKNDIDTKNNIKNIFPPLYDESDNESDNVIML